MNSGRALFITAGIVHKRCAGCAGGMGFDRLGRIVVDAIHAADLALAQSAVRSSLVTFHKAVKCHKLRIRLRIPYTTAHRKRRLIGIENFARRCEVGKRARRCTCSAAEIRYIRIKAEAVRIDLLRERNRCGLQEQPVQVVHVGGALDCGKLDVNGCQMVELYGDTLLLHVLCGHTCRLVKLLCLINDRLAHLDGITLEAKSFGIILVDQVRKHKVVDQTRKRLPRNVLNRKKRIGHLLSPLTCSC